MLAAFARILLRRLVFEDGLLAAGAADEAAAPLLPLLLCQVRTPILLLLLRLGLLSGMD